MTTSVIERSCGSHPSKQLSQKVEKISWGSQTTNGAEAGVLLFQAEVLAILKHDNYVLHHRGYKNYLQKAETFKMEGSLKG